MDKMEIGQLIQYSLTPGIMISSSALFLLGLQTRFSNLFSRFRVLNQERRALEQASPRNADENKRLQNLVLQLDQLIRRAGTIKNAILCFYGAILCFVGTSLCLFLAHFTALPLGKIGALGFFAGMVFILTACLFLISEVVIAFNILALERRS